MGMLVAMEKELQIDFADIGDGVSEEVEKLAATTGEALRSMRTLLGHIGRAIQT